MKNYVDKYHLKEGFLIAIIFPLIFALSDSNSSNVFSPFISSFTIIFSLWIVNFILIDFKSVKNQSSKSRLLNMCVKPLASFILAILIYVAVGFLLDRSGSLLSEIREHPKASFNSWLYLSIKIVLFNALIILLKYLYDSNSDKRKIAFENEVLKRENLVALHETLKQQVNPHFLFNSLNTLKSLTKRCPDQAVHFIDELSSVYRYMLLHQDKKIVTIGEEIEFLRSYLYLLKIRFGDAINTEIVLPDELLKQSMPPNTLQLLIENAVKHNALSTKRPLCISIYTKDDYLVVRNNLQFKPQQTSTSSHFGLSNISNRYLLLNRKDIIIKKTEKDFLVLLPVN